MVQGAMSALITPFKQGRVDFETYESLIRPANRLWNGRLCACWHYWRLATLSHKEHMGKLLKLRWKFAKEVG